MKRLFLLCLLVVAAFLLWGEEERPKVFAPFVSGLKATPGESSITLTWKGSRDVLGLRLIYRHTDEISERNFKEAEFIARLTPETESYLDYPPDQKNYYYAVLLEDEGGKVYTLFIAFRNKTTLGLGIVSPAPEENMAARITDIDTRIVEDSILISFQASKPNRELLLFRHTAPIRQSDDLLAAASPVVLDKNVTGYLDNPIPEIDYYYAVIDAGLFKIGKPELSEGENSTVNPAQLPLGLGRIGLKPDASPLKLLPLPYLLITTGVELGDELPPSSPFLLPTRVESLQPATVKAISQILTEVKQSSRLQKDIEILTVDQAANVRGEAYTLQTILKDQLLKKKFREAEKQLINFLSIRRSEDIEARTRFYLGQIFYFQGLYREAFIEFLLAQDAYYQKIQPWLNACYRKLQEQGN